MRLAYQDEQEIADLAAHVADADTCFYPAESDLGRKFLASLRGGALMQRERPDFEDTSAVLLLEAMRVDDHPRPGKKDATRAREGQVAKELREASWAEAFPDATLFANVSSGLPTGQDHNYRAYVDHFTSVVAKHARNVGTYRNERPSFDLGFLVLDESTPYFESLGSFGPANAGRIHWWFADSAFVNAIMESNVDCFVWLTPYKRAQALGVGDVPLPKMTIIDVSLLKRVKTETYDPKRMDSTEL